MKNFRIGTFLTLFLLLAQIALGAMSVEQAQTVMREALGRDIPFHLLEERPGGEYVNVQKAREEVVQARGEAAKRNREKFFPAASKGDAKLWRKVKGTDNKTYYVPNESHPNYKKFLKACDADYANIDRTYQDRVGKRLQAFSEQVFRYGNQDKIQTVGREQKNLFSDVDVTFKDPAQREAFIVLMREQGFTVEVDEKHGLYAKVKELDYTQWGHENVKTLQQDILNEKDPARRQALQTRLDHAMKDLEVCATTVGARHDLLKEGTADKRGSKLDTLKKFAQSDDIYTKSKTMGKLLKADYGEDKVYDHLSGTDQDAAKKLSQHAGDTAALRMEHLPPGLREQAREEYKSRITQEAVDSYRRSVVESYVAGMERQAQIKSLQAQAKIHDQSGNTDLARQARDRIRAIQDHEAAVRLGNRRTFQAIADADPQLAKKLSQAEKEAKRLFVQDRDAAKNAVRDPNALRKYCRDYVEANKPKKPWISPQTLAAAKQAGATFMAKGELVVDSVGRLGGYAAIADQAAALEAAGKGKASTIMAKELAKDVAMEGLTRKVPGFGSAMQIFDVPMMMKSEMEAEVDKAVANNSSIFNAKAKAILTVMKKKTFIGTVQDILNEEGMDEVEREQRTGTYDWTGVFTRTAVRSAGEITQLNAIMRYGNNLKYGVYEKEKQARLEQEQLRNKLATKTVASDHNLEAIRQKIVRLQLNLEADDPIVEARIRELQAEYDKGIRGMVTLGQKMRKQFGTTDRQVEDLYKRAAFAKTSQRSDLLEARLARTLATKDVMTPEGYVAMKRVSDELMEETRKFRDELKKLHAARGGSSDPLVKELMAKYDRLRTMNKAANAISYDEVVRNTNFRENAEAARKRQAELDGYARMVKEQADKLPPGVAEYDQALVIEIDDLKIRQEKGEVPADADLVAIAGQNVLRDITYRELREKQEAGEIPADADLLDLLDQAMGVEPEVDVVADVPANVATAANDAGPARGGQVVPAKSSGGDFAATPPEPEDTQPPSGGFPESLLSGDDVKRTVEKHGNGRVARLRLSRGRQYLEKRWNADGRLSFEKLYYSSENYQEHGFHSGGGMSHETVQKGQNRTKRSWDAQGFMREYRLFYQGKPHGRQLHYHPGSTTVSLEENYRFGKPDGAYRTWDENGKLTEFRQHRDGQKTGTWMAIRTKRQRRERTEQTWEQDKLVRTVVYNDENEQPISESIADDNGFAIRRQWYPDSRQLQYETRTNLRNQTRTQVRYAADGTIVEEFHAVRWDKGRGVASRYFSDRSKEAQQLEKRLRMMEKSGGKGAADSSRVVSLKRSYTPEGCLTKVELNAGTGRTFDMLKQVSPELAKHYLELRKRYSDLPPLMRPNYRAPKIYRHQWASGKFAEYPLYRKDGRTSIPTNAIPVWGERDSYGHYSIYYLDRQGFRVGYRRFQSGGEPIVDVAYHVAGTSTKRQERHGLERKWHFNKPYKLEQETMWHRGKMHGPKKVYNRDGILIEESTYRDHKMAGRKTTYAVNNKTKERYKSGEYNFVDGKLSGPFKKWRGRDDLSEEGTYLNNVLHGKVMRYYKGIKTEETHYAYGQKHGKSLSWNGTTGKLSRSGQFDNGLQHGEFINYHYQTGKETNRRYYQYGKVVTADQFRKGAGAPSLSLDGQPYWNLAVPQKAASRQQGNRITYTLDGKEIGYRMMDKGTGLIVIEELWLPGVEKTGVKRQWRIGGEIRDITFFRKGKKCGAYARWLPNYNQWSVRHYIDDKSQRSSNYDRLRQDDPSLPPGKAYLMAIQPQKPK
jgi:antitoxin component YwqK of YwqJK toxin-antitoxin module